MKPDNNSWEDLRLVAHGDTCVIIGNGPSLNKVPDALFEKYDTFGTNRIYLKRIPMFYVCVNPLVIEQFAKDMDGLDCTAKFIRWEYADRIMGSFPLLSLPQPHFSHTPHLGVYEGFTVTYVCMQLAWWMNYQNILLVGVDHRYTFHGKPNEQNILVGNDPNHFDPDYFKGAQWNNPDLSQSEKSYRMAKSVFEYDGRRIINLGPDSALDIFERGEIKDWL